MRDKLLYIGTTQSALDTVNASSSVSRKLGQITRINGRAQPNISGALDNGDCDLILTNKAAVEYFNTH